MPLPPRIALATGCARTNERNFQAQLSYSYIRSVELAGGAPLLLPTTEDEETLTACLEGIDGLILPGGPDLDPALYGETPHPMLEPVSGPRQGYDIRLCRRAFEAAIPILGICHGCQVINVAFGGTLHQDMLTAFPDSPIVHRRRIFPFYTPHAVRVAPGSRLRDVVATDRYPTNSAHHQAVKRPGGGLKPVAWADDETIEAIEWTEDERFVLGIQAHPEKLAEIKEDEHRRMFRALVREARERRRR